MNDQISPGINQTPPLSTSSRASRKKTSSQSTTTTRKRPAARGSAAYARKRAVTACQVCRARRTKCDNKKPSCSFCEKVGAKCITSSVDLSTFDPASLRILERLDQLEQRLFPENISPGSQDEENGQVVVTNEQPTSKPLQITITDVLSWPGFHGRWDNQLDTISLLRRQPAIRTAPSHEPLDLYLQDPAWRNQLLANFLTNVHIKNPILEELTLRHMIDNNIVNILDSSNAESCLILLIYALGVISIPFGNVQQLDPDTLDLANSFFNLAQTKLGILLGRGDMIAAQCFFYAGVFQMSVFNPVPAWRFFLQALACCQEFEYAAHAIRNSQRTGLHASAASPAEQRLYWSCWKSEVELRVCLDPFDFQIQDRVYPGDFPTPPTESSEDLRAWYFYLAEISLRRLNTRARNDLSHLPRPNNQIIDTRLLDAVTSFENQAEAWVDSLPNTIALQSLTNASIGNGNDTDNYNGNDNDNNNDDDILRFILRCHLIDFQEVIYWPFLEAVIHQPAIPRTSPHDSTLIEIESYARKSLQNCLDRIRNSRTGFMHRHHGTWMLLQSCTRSALVLLAAASQPGRSRTCLPAKWRDAVYDVIRMLKFWERDAVDASSRLKILEESLREVS